MLSSDDLPAPEGPSSAVSVPGRAENVMLESTVRVEDLDEAGTESEAELWTLLLFCVLSLCGTTSETSLTSTMVEKRRVTKKGWRRK